MSSGNSPPDNPGGQDGAGRHAREVQHLLGDLKGELGPLWHSLISYVQAQWEIGRFLLTEGTRLAAARVVLSVALLAMLITAWVMLNVTLWKFVGYYTDVPFLPPLSVTAVHAFLALFLFARLRRMRL